MDTGNGGIMEALRTMLPQVPLISKTALAHTLGYSETAKEWDLRTALFVTVLRSFVGGPSLPLAKMQKLSMRAGEVKGRVWISRVTLSPPPEDSVRQALFGAIEALKEDGQAKGGFTEPNLLPVEAEWTGYRADATPQSLEPTISEEEKYKEMMKEVSSPTTTLYLHGGALYLMDPVTHRPTCKKLAKITKGRCLNVRYRLAPQHPFPAALLDALVAYMTLLYPPPGSLHTAVQPEHIVFAGDSAGGNLSMALLQTILQLRRQDVKINWHCEERQVPIPGGVATCSAWLDVTHSSPSCDSNARYDYLPARSVKPNGTEYPHDAIWPTQPPRNNLYAEDAFLMHPLVSPVAAKDWTGSCPLYFGVGQELLTDESKYVAALAAKQGVTVVFEEYMAMPHVFCAFLGHLPAARLFYDSWGGFIRDVTDKSQGIAAKGTNYEVKTLKTTDLDVEKICEFSREELTGWMKERVVKMGGKHPDPLSKL